MRQEIAGACEGCPARVCFRRVTPRSGIFPRAEEKASRTHTLSGLLGAVCCRRLRNTAWSYARARGEGGAHREEGVVVVGARVAKGGW